jgi:hypothetical protein
MSDSVIRFSASHGKEWRWKNAVKRRALVAGEFGVTPT